MRLAVLLVVLTMVLAAVAAAPSDRPERKHKKERGGMRKKGADDVTGTKNEVDRTQPSKGKGGKQGGKHNKCNTNPPVEKPSCHSKAVRRCGRNFIAELHRKEGPDGKVPYKEKCMLRETFLNCVSENRVKQCRSHGHSNKLSQREEMKRVATYLWSTRGCVLGVDA